MKKVKNFLENNKSADDNTKHIIKDPAEISVITDGVSVVITSLVQSHSTGSPQGYARSHNTIQVNPTDI